MSAEPVQAKVARNGQMSLPAVIRHRWHANSVLVIDRGEYAIVRPIPDDIVETLRGSYAGPGPSAEEARAAERGADLEREARRKRR